MRGTLVIFKKELKAYFLSPIFYLIAFLVTTLLSVMFTLSLAKFTELASNPMLQLGLSPAQQNIHYGVFLPHLSLLNLMFIFLIPAFCMRLLAEEKKTHTFDLLLTSPVRSIDIVLGKYFATLVVVFFLLLISMIYPLIARRMAEFYWSSTLVAALGIFLVAAVYVAMDLFASSLTESALVAFVLAIVFNMGIWFIGALNDSIDLPWLKNVFEHISLNTHLAGMIEGIIRTSGLVFLFSLIFLFCFLTERMIESSRWRS